MKRRLLPILMTLVLVCALPIWAAFVTSGDVTNPLVCTAGAAELTLQERIDRANAGATITLSGSDFLKLRTRCGTTILRFYISLLITI